MITEFKESVVAVLAGFTIEIKILIISMMPILEQKASIPIGIASGMNAYLVYFYTLIGAILPAPFIYYGVKFIFPYLKKIKYIGRVIDLIEKKGRKQTGKILKYELLGLFLFVAIPLPGTGVWTGTLAASMLNLGFKKSMISISFGAAACGGLILLGTDMIINITNLIIG
ncbi:MAG: small multi-drug export protein [Clostridia bacterium]|jgi:uncharacterized membrane protein|nr:small multi-drug export protein [Clostridia bacterium]